MIIHDQIAHHAARYDITAEPGTRDAAERLLDAGLERGSAHSDWPFARKRRAAPRTVASTSAIEPTSDAPAAR